MTDAIEAALGSIRANGLNPRLLYVEDAGTLRISLPMSKAAPMVVRKLKTLLMASPGPRAVELELINGPRAYVLALPMKVKVTAALVEALELLVGPEVVH